MPKDVCTIHVRTKNFPLETRDIQNDAALHLKSRGFENSRFELEVVGRKKMKSLNNVFMHKDYPTDVLSFPLDKIPGEQTYLIGTIFICNDIIIKESTKKGSSFWNEFRFLMRHGIDHLVGIHHD